MLALGVAARLVNESGDVMKLTYNARLADLELKKTVWRGKFAFDRGSGLNPLSALASQEKRGAVFAVDVATSLKRDALLTGCSPDQRAGPTEKAAEEAAGEILSL